MLRKPIKMIYALMSVVCVIIVCIIGYYFAVSNQIVKQDSDKMFGTVMSVGINNTYTTIVKNNRNNLEEIKRELKLPTKLSIVKSEEVQKYDDILEDRLLIFHDEFEGDTLNTEYWNIDKDFNRNSELQIYCEADVTVSGGVVKIVARRNNTYNSSFQWTAGEISTQGKIAFQNCRMEAKIRMDNKTGFCPAFWTLGDTIGGWNWPRCGEIDIFEAPHLNMINCNNHFADKENVHKTWGTSQKEDVDLTQWHIYAMEIKDGIITTYFDGEQIDWFDTDQMEYYDGVNPFKQSIYPIFNISVGGSASEGVPADDIGEVSMEIDWVRVYANEGITENEAIPQSFDMEYLGNSEVFADNRIQAGECVQLFPVYYPQSHVQAGIRECKVENKEICTCSNGYITALKSGKTRILVRDSYGLESVINVEVTE